MGTQLLAAYQLERSSSAFGSWIIIANGLSIFGQNGFPDTQLANNTSYFYRAQAVDLSGRSSAYSNIAIGTTAAIAADTQPPTIPTIPEHSIDSSTQITLTLDPSSDVTIANAVASGLGGHKIYRDGTLLQILAAASAGSTGLATIQDVGNVLQAGSGSQSGADFTLTGYSNDTSGMRFAWRLISGDFTLIALVNFPTASLAFAKAMVTARAALTATAAYATMVAFPDNFAQGLNFEYRDGNGGTEGQATLLTGITGIRSFKLQRIGNLFNGYYWNGTRWILQGSFTIASMPAAIYWGVAVSDGGSAGTTATFSQVNWQNLPRITYQDTGLAANSTHSYCVSAYDVAGNESAQSTALSLTTLSATLAFPRTAANPVGGGGEQLISSPTSRDMVARFKSIVIGANNEQWFGGGLVATTRQELSDDLKSRALGYGIQQAQSQYFDLNELFTDRSINSHQYWYDIVAANNWWTYQAGTSGAYSGYSDSGYPKAMVNMTHYAGQDGSGNYPYEAGAAYMHGFLNTGAYRSANVATAMDSVTVDNLFQRPYQAGDWNRDGTSDSSDATVQAAFRTGEKDVITKYNALSGKLVRGNISDWAYQKINTPGADFSPLYGAVHGGDWENALGGVGSTYGSEYYYGTATWLQLYDWMLAGCQAPKLLHVVTYVQPNGSDIVIGNNNFQAARYNQGLVALNDGYFCPCLDTSVTSAQLFEFDEMFGGSLNNRNWLGTPIDAGQTAVWSGTVYRRRFSGGAVFVNPRGAAAQTIDLTGYVRLLGTQAPSVNNGAAGGAYQLAGGDAIFVRAA